MRIVVTGKFGQLATALMERAAWHGVTVILVGRPEFDLASPFKGLSSVAAAKPDVIVSAAAYTAVDQSESDYKKVRSINVDGPAVLAEFASRSSVPLIHLSTDYVFDGSKTTPYIEDDATNPLNVYGATKLAGEIAVASATSNYAILRTAWVYSPFGSNFLKTMLRLGCEQSEIKVVGDQTGNPTSAFDLADAIISVAWNMTKRPDDQGLRGIFHATGTGHTSRANFAAEIFDVSWALGGPYAFVMPVVSEDYPTKVRRPVNSALSCDKLRRLHGVEMPKRHISLRPTIARILSANT